MSESKISSIRCKLKKVVISITSVFLETNFIFIIVMNIFSKVFITNNFIQHSQ